MAKAQSQPLSESEIKAGFLFNFTKFVEWPPDAFADPSVLIVVGIVGDNPVTDLLTETAAGKTVNGRAVVVRRFPHANGDSQQGRDPAPPCAPFGFEEGMRPHRKKLSLTYVVSFWDAKHRIEPGISPCGRAAFPVSVST
jgi:hypothetical protein